MTDIRNMLHDLSMKNQNQNKNRLSDILKDVEMHDDGSAQGRASFISANNPFSSPDKFMDGENEDNVVEFVKRQKAQIKELSAKLDQSKRDYKESEAEVEDLRLKDPSLYRKKKEVLDKVNETLERKIDKLNQRIAKVKEIESKIR